MNLKEFREVINRIPNMYDETEVSFIANHKEYLVKDIENDIEWYEDDIHDNVKRIDIVVS